jgi:hypothetical protein
VSVPSGAVTGIEHVRPVAVAVHAVDVDEMSAMTGVIPVIAISTDDADGETNRGARRAPVARASGTAMVTDPKAVEVLAVLGTGVPGAVELGAGVAAIGSVPAPLPALLQAASANATHVVEATRTTRRFIDLSGSRPAFR